MLFYDFMFRNQGNKWFVRIGIVVVILQFIVFKILYPFAGFINGDSYVYLESAYHNLSINTYPIGYSKFLRLVSVFSKSDTVFVGLQYFFLQGSILLLVFTIFFFYKPMKWTRILLFGFMICNPVFLYVANYVSSDALFLSFSFVWFSLLLWIMNKPSWELILINAIVLFLSFTIRYNALFYPIIGVVGLILSRRKVLLNVAGFSLSMLLIYFFVQATSAKYKEVTGYRQFSPFTGWQLANNALYTYRYVDSAHVLKVPAHLKEIDAMVRAYFDTTKDITKFPQETLVASTVYMWDPKSPLSLYAERQFKNDSTASALKKWATAAPMMKEYGSFIIRNYPREFAVHYLLPNALKYYAPPVEFLEKYNMGIDSVDRIAKVWFDYKSNKVRSYFRESDVRVLSFFPILTGMMNVVLVFSMISFIILRGYRYSVELGRGLILVVALWAVNFAFSVFASPIALRFQLFPILVSISFTFLLIEFLIRCSRGNIAQDVTKDSGNTHLNTEGMLS